MFNLIRSYIRKKNTWIKFQELNREGWHHAYLRISIQKKILKTPPIYTAATGKKEIRILTWRRDWINALWSLKSFYYFSEADYPLYIHDGGLEKWQINHIKHHFPNSVIITSDESDRKVNMIFSKHGLLKCLEYRRKNVSTRKIFDFFLLSDTDFIISIDPDIVFFKKPTELLLKNYIKNLYNKDLAYAYSMGLEEIEQAFGIRPPPLVNSGLSLVRRASINFEKINKWLDHPKLFSNTWVTEQTLHALCSTIHGLEFLPDTYLVSVSPGLPENLICKHYPGFFRHLLYHEGMKHLFKTCPIFKTMAV